MKAVYLRFHWFNYSRTRGSELVTREFEVVTNGFELATREFEFAIRRFELSISIREEELISTPKINTFWPNPTPGNEKLDLLSNPIP